jgi:CMP-N,N'-diacetyllegionaminic acid synthase
VAIVSERAETMAIIPARGGSRAVPGKNIRPVAGRPLLAWTIDAAREARAITRVIVSTDSVEIAEVARRHGAEVPMMRPSGLARDDTPAIDAILHAVDWLHDHEGYCPDYVSVLQPTSPLRTAADIDAAMAVLRARSAAAVVGVCLAPHHPQWMKRVEDDGAISSLFEFDESLPRQQLPPVYVLNGSLYLVRRDVLKERRSLYAEKTYPYVMPIERSLDIDTAWDLQVADLVLSARRQEHL